ncbi:MAG: hypothetical protein HYZ69_03715 [Candidatus Colwellbacteria bacterium]|nr:hypothetical protein [Candidatus Colwellbacteria bacterium]
MLYNPWLLERISFLVIFEKKKSAAVPLPIGAIVYAEPDVEIASVSETVTVELSLPVNLLQRMHRLLVHPTKTANDSPQKILSLYLRYMISAPEYEVKSVVDLHETAAEETYS